MAGRAEESYTCPVVGGVEQLGCCSPASCSTRLRQAEVCIIFGVTAGKLENTMIGPGCVSLLRYIADQGNVTFMTNGELAEALGGAPAGGGHI